jgi:hypothetical protein
MATAQTARPLDDLIVRQLSSVPEVEQILVSQDEEAIRVWSIVNHLPADRRHCLYACENDLLRRHLDLPLDFRVVDRKDTPADKLIPGARIIWQTAAAR